MNMLDLLNNSISYIEENLMEEIDYQELARIACCSEHHFKRVFSFIAGISVSEYIRRRRLTLAALEIKRGNVRVLDIAVKYGYNSADSFSRAFQALHGVTPTLAKENEVPLKAFPRMAFQIAIKGDVEMNYRFVEKEAFTIVGMKETVHSAGNHFQPKLWDEIDGPRYKQLEKLANTEVPGILHATVSKSQDTIDYYIAVVTNVECPKEFTKLEIQKQTWAVFEAVGPMPETMLTTWERIYTEWFPNSGYELADAPELVREADNDDSKQEIWIPIVKK
ncbi:AraC family transcriptional regulator [Sutcliffiella halmapala]|uniref:AraC family transcriptional regulator n=1 Tax=Sutcliffiella halmapala TaxID=79882 RepID=UPI000994AC33|nr:AraC family transcriptional regulator [Sutcliffiella halmapala]